MSNEHLLEQDFMETSEDRGKYLMIRLGKQVFGVLVDSVEDVLFPHDITEIPLSPSDVMGMINLRGRIVTAIDLGLKLGLDPVDINGEYRSIVVEKNGYLYSLVVNNVSEVLDIPLEKIANTPDNLSEKWKQVSIGVHSLEKDLMVILDVERVVDCDDLNENDEVDE